MKFNITTGARAVDHIIRCNRASKQQQLNMSLRELIIALSLESSAALRWVTSMCILRSLYNSKWFCPLPRERKNSFGWQSYCAQVIHVEFNYHFSPVCKWCILVLASPVTAGSHFCTCSYTASGPMNTSTVTKHLQSLMSYCSERPMTS